MFAYVLRRLIYMPFILLGVIFITFILFQMSSTPEAQARTHVSEKAEARQVYDWLASKGLITWTEAGEAKIKAIGEDKLPPTQAQFISEDEIEDIQSGISAIATGTIDLQEEVDEYLLDSGSVESDWDKAYRTKVSELIELLSLDDGNNEVLDILMRLSSIVNIFLDLAKIEAQIEHLQSYAKQHLTKGEVAGFNELRAKQGGLKNKLITFNQRRDAVLSGARLEWIILEMGAESFELSQSIDTITEELAAAKDELAKSVAVVMTAAEIQKLIEDQKRSKENTVLLEKSLEYSSDAYIDIAPLENKISKAIESGEETKLLEAKLAKKKAVIAESANSIPHLRTTVADKSIELQSAQVALTVYKTQLAKAGGIIIKMSDIKADFTYTNFFVNFKVYLFDILHLEFGDTLDSRSVMATIYEGMWPSLALTLPAFFLAELIGLFFGLFAAMYRQTKIDNSIVVSSILLMSINGIALIMFGQKFIAADLNYFPVQGYAEGFGAVRFLMLPIFLYIVITFGERIRFNRIVMLDETNQDYVRTARAKGVGENSILFKHVFRNTLIPLITRWAVAIPSLYLGSLVLESFFSIPGLGNMTVDAIRNSDSNVIRAVVVFGSISFMLANLVSDILYAVADPRVKLS